MGALTVVSIHPTSFVLSELPPVTDREHRSDDPFLRDFSGSDRTLVTRYSWFSRLGRMVRVTGPRSRDPGVDRHPSIARRRETVKSMTETRILVVEDEQGILEPLSSHLSREGFVPTIAPTIADAHGAFAEVVPDLVLLDVMLPDGDGRDLCRELRASTDVPS
jgi:hypothetical protein